jgi:hypothetical protein
MFKYISILLVALTVLLFACKSGKKPEQPESGETIEEISAAPFSADSAYVFIAKQASFGPRVPNTAEHRKCGLWLENTLKRFTTDVTVQSFKTTAYNGTSLDLKNIIASFNPQATSRVLLCAHWDSRPYADYDPDLSKHRTPIDGVNDGASGVGILLEAARQFSSKVPVIGVDIILLDGEDYGAPNNEKSELEDDWALGAQNWSKNPHKPGYSAKYGILLDMVGAENATFTREGTSMYYAPDVMNKIWNIASRIGHSSYFVPENSNGITDDHLYINEIIKIPTIDIIHHDPSTESGFFRHWHTTQDNIAVIDKNTLKAVGETVLTAIYNEK